MPFKCHICKEILTLTKLAEDNSIVNIELCMTPCGHFHHKNCLLPTTTRITASSRPKLKKCPHPFCNNTRLYPVTLIYPVVQDEGVPTAPTIVQQANINSNIPKPSSIDLAPRVMPNVVKCLNTTSVDEYTLHQCLVKDFNDLLNKLSAQERSFQREVMLKNLRETEIDNLKKTLEAQRKEMSSLLKRRRPSSQEEDEESDEDEMELEEEDFEDLVDNAPVSSYSDEDSDEIVEGGEMY